ncbi:hypothetical protein Tco_0096649 [Tanacetum coccineum]
MSSMSLSFLQSAACSYSNLNQTKLFVQSPLPLRKPSLVITAAARTRQDNRQARHARIRVNVEFLVQDVALIKMGKLKQSHASRKDHSVTIPDRGGLSLPWTYSSAC